jgi:hypothetical protein
VRWSKTMSATLRKPGPIAPSRTAETLASGLAADPLFYDLLPNLPLHLKHKVGLERVVGIGGLRFSGF